MTSAHPSAVLDETIVAAPPQVDKDVPAARCDVCAHPLDAHDPIARRYCTATFANAISRGCICG